MNNDCKECLCRNCFLNTVIDNGVRKTNVDLQCSINGCPNCLVCENKSNYRDKDECTSYKVYK